jgi:hypothetical protein
METYAVVWREGSGPTYMGRLELGAVALLLDGSGDGGSLARHRISYSDMAGIRIGRSSADRLNGSPSVILDRRAGPPVSIAAVNGLGRIFDLGGVIAELTARQTETSSRVVVVLPIKRHTRERARQLIASGPPFDPSSVPLQHHRVFVTNREVVFLFEGEDVREVVEQLVRRPDVWKAAIAWRECLAGPPRVADEAYGWVRNEANEPR